jgi:hypothetical protein
LTFRFVEQIIDGFHERFSKKWKVLWPVLWLFNLLSIVIIYKNWLFWQCWSPVREYIPSLITSGYLSLVLRITQLW